MRRSVECCADRHAERAGTLGEGARVGIVGAGIVGLAVAREVARRWPGTQLTVYDKEPEVGAHQTGRNSGVVHAGMYYTPGSLKAQLCTEGGGLLRRYCQERGIPVDPVGKLIIAASPDEVDRLRDIYDRAVLNSVPGVTIVDGRGLREIEPHAEGVAAIHSPHTAAVDFRIVAQSLADDMTAAGGRLRLGTTVQDIDQAGAAASVSTGADTETFDVLFSCAGLGGDRILRMAGMEDDLRIVPFRGEYFRLIGEARDLVKGMIYPVPDPRYPFLGVHLTRTVAGEVLVGPNAVLALAAEGYRWRDIEPRSLWRTLTWPGFRTLARAHWRVGFDEVRRSLSKRRFVEAARRYVPELEPHMVDRYRSGVRAQALDRDGSLVDDFAFAVSGNIVAVRNAPSPAATSSLAIARHIVDQAASLVEG